MEKNEELIRVEFNNYNRSTVLNASEFFNLPQASEK
jgi:hypothetical protein